MTTKNAMQFKAIIKNIENVNKIKYTKKVETRELTSLFLPLI